jgi:hypothetical protein
MNENRAFSSVEFQGLLIVSLKFRTDHFLKKIFAYGRGNVNIGEVKAC